MIVSLTTVIIDLRFFIIIDPKILSNQFKLSLSLIKIWLKQRVDCPLPDQNHFDAKMILNCFDIYHELFK